MEITNDRRRELEGQTLEASTPASSGPAEALTPLPSARSLSDADFAHAYDRLPDSAEYGAYLVQLRSSAVAPATRRPSDTEIQQRLDEFRDRFSGPYAVDGKPVTARPMFRMNMESAQNADLQKKSWKELGVICAKANVPSYAWMCVSGRCTPEQLVRTTQLLLDAGKLPPADEEHTTIESRIRLMQWQFGIGVDCAGYTQRAAAFAHGDAGRAFGGNVMSDIFTNMGKDPRFVKVAPADIRPGDVIHLNNPEPTGVGHNVIVRDHTQLSDDAKKDLRRTFPNTAAFFESAGPFHVLEVDSSWGAGNGNDYGGFRRDTWIYDASKRAWASYTIDDPRVLVPSPIGPQDEIFAGAYRPRL